MSIEYVSRHLSFENLLVEVTVQRWICDSCGRRECFHDSHKPYNEHVPDPKERGWRLGITLEDGDQEPCWCRKCCEERDAREAIRALPQGKE